MKNATDIFEDIVVRLMQPDMVDHVQERFPMSTFPRIRFVPLTVQT